MNFLDLYTHKQLTRFIARQIHVTEILNFLFTTIMGRKKNTQLTPEEQFHESYCEEDQITVRETSFIWIAITELTEQYPENYGFFSPRAIAGYIHQTYAQRPQMRTSRKKLIKEFSTVKVTGICGLASTTFMMSISQKHGYIQVRKLDPVNPPWGKTRFASSRGGVYWEGIEDLTINDDGVLYLTRPFDVRDDIANLKDDEEAEKSRIERLDSARITTEGKVMPYRELGDYGGKLRLSEIEEEDETENQKESEKIEKQEKREKAKSKETEENKDDDEDVNDCDLQNFVNNIRVPSGTAVSDDGEDESFHSTTSDEGEPEEEKATGSNQVTGVSRDKPAPELKSKKTDEKKVRATAKEVKSSDSESSYYIVKTEKGKNDAFSENTDVELTIRDEEREKEEEQKKFHAAKNEEREKVFANAERLRREAIKIDAPRPRLTDDDLRSAAQLRQNRMERMTERELRAFGAYEIPKVMKDNKGDPKLFCTREGVFTPEEWKRLMIIEKEESERLTQKARDEETESHKQWRLARSRKKEENYKIFKKCRRMEGDITFNIAKACKNDKQFDEVCQMLDMYSLEFSTDSEEESPSERKKQDEELEKKRLLKSISPTESPEMTEMKKENMENWKRMADYIGGLTSAMSSLASAVSVSHRSRDNRSVASLESKKERSPRKSEEEKEEENSAIQMKDDTPEDNDTPDNNGTEPEDPFGQTLEDQLYSARQKYRDGQFIEDIHEAEGKPLEQTIRFWNDTATIGRNPPEFEIYSGPQLWITGDGSWNGPKDSMIEGIHAGRRGIWEDRKDWLQYAFNGLTVTSFTMNEEERMKMKKLMNIWRREIFERPISMRITNPSVYGDLYAKVDTPTPKDGMVMISEDFQYFKDYLRSRRGNIRVQNDCHGWLRGYCEPWAKHRACRRGWTFEALIDVMPTPKREEKFEFVVVNVGLRLHDDPNRIKWRIPNIDNVVPIDIVRNRKDSAPHLLMKDEEYYVSTIDTPCGGIMYLWLGDSREEDLVEAEWIKNKIEDGKRIGYKKPEDTKGKRSDNSVDTRSNK